MDKDIKDEETAAIVNKIFSKLITRLLSLLIRAWFLMLVWNWIIPVLFSEAVASGMLTARLSFIYALGVLLLSNLIFKSINDAE